LQVLPQRLALVIGLLLLTTASAIAAQPTVPVAELQPGQTGYGLTVFTGTEVDTFSMTVLGIRHGTRAGGDIIMVELAGHDLERSAVAQGMSGSPVYLDDGRLVGAVAFGWPGALRPIAGLTPAAELLAAGERRDMPYASNQTNTADPTDLMGADHGGVFASRMLGTEQPITEPAPNTNNTWPTPESLATRLIPRPKNLDANNLAPLDLGLYAIPASAAAAQATAATPQRFVPGSACAVALVTGGAQLGAIGTVSTVDGDRIVCMAHPFMQLGPVNLPLATAEIISIFPSREISFKIGSAGTVIGRVTHDLRAGLAGEMSTMAPTAPVSVTVDLPTGQRTLDFEVAQLPSLTPQLVFWCLYNTLLIDGDDRSDQLVNYTMTVTVADEQGHELPPLELNGVSGGAGGVAALAADWQAPLAILLSNRHQRLHLAGVEATITIERPTRAAIVRALHGPALITPGQEFTVEVELEHRHGTVTREVFNLTAPADLKPGPLRLGAASAREFFALDAMRASGLFQDHGLEATFDLLSRPRSLDDLTVALVAARPGFTAGGRELSNLPGSVSQTLSLGPPGATQRTLAAYLLRQSRHTGIILQGNAVKDVSVRAQPAPRPEKGRP